MIERINERRGDIRGGGMKRNWEGKRGREGGDMERWKREGEEKKGEKKDR